MKDVRAFAYALFFFFFALSSFFVAIAQARAHDASTAAPRVLKHFDQRTSANAELIQSYLQVLKLSLTGELLKTDGLIPGTGTTEQLQKIPFDAHIRRRGTDWPSHGLTMVGRTRLDNIERLLLRVIDAQVPGDFVECGVWRGGSSLFARAVLKALRVQDRTVHLVDSFEGLPKASQAKDNDIWSEMDYLKVSLEQVQEPFEQLGLLDHGVAFHKGFFQHSLPPLRKQLLAEKKSIAILRMDGDMFESTMDILYNLYDLVAAGGCIIIDDFAIAAAREAVAEFLEHHGLTVNYVPIDETGSYFCKEVDTKVDSAWYANFNKNRTTTPSLPP